MASRRFKTVLVQDDKTTGCGIELPFNPKEAFGKVRTPVKVTINDFTFLTTTCAMGGSYWIPMNKQNRQEAGIEAGDSITVRMELDQKKRTITPPADLGKAIKANKRAQAAWTTLSYTQQKEHARSIEEAKKPETRQRRIKKAIETLASTPPKKRR